MKIHEYQAKAILKKYGVAVPRGEMAETAGAGGSRGKACSTLGPRASWSRRRFMPAAGAKAEA